MVVCQIAGYIIANLSRPLTNSFMTRAGQPRDRLVEIVGFPEPSTICSSGDDGVGEASGAPISSAGIPQLSQDHLRFAGDFVEMKAEAASVLR
jgi:hypothetical protein